MFITREEAKQYNFVQNDKIIYFNVISVIGIAGACRRDKRI